MRKAFDDPQYAPPADLTPAEARDFEEAVLASIRQAIQPGPYGPWRIIDSIELEGERPETTVVFKYREISDPKRLLAGIAPIWEDIAHDVQGTTLLDSAPSVGGSIFSAFNAGELEPTEVS